MCKRYICALRDKHMHPKNKVPKQFINPLSIKKTWKHHKNTSDLYSIDTSLLSSHCRRSVTDDVSTEESGNMADTASPIMPRSESTNWLAMALFSWFSDQCMHCIDETIWYHSTAFIFPYYKRLSGNDSATVTHRSSRQLTDWSCARTPIITMIITLSLLTDWSCAGTPIITMVSIHSIHHNDHHIVTAHWLIMC